MRVRVCVCGMCVCVHVLCVWRVSVCVCVCTYVWCVFVCMTYGAAVNACLVANLFELVLVTAVVPGCICQYFSCTISSFAITSYDGLGVDLPTDEVLGFLWFKYNSLSLSPFPSLSP